MNKSELKNILLSIRTQDNEPDVNFLLGKLDMLEEEKIAEHLTDIGDSEISIKNYFNNQIQKLKIAELRKEKRYSINELFTYGIKDNLVHLHLPGDLHELIKNKGFKGAIDTVNLYLLDALDKIQQLKENQHPNLKNIDNVYMISPILLKSELKFLEELDFQTTTYSKNDLSNKDFINKNSEAQFAANIFGTDRNVGTAKIPLHTLSTEDWKNKKQNKVNEFNNKGIFIEESQKEEEIE